MTGIPLLLCTNIFSNSTYAPRILRVLFYYGVLGDLRDGVQNGVYSNGIIIYGVLVGSSTRSCNRALPRNELVASVLCAMLTFVGGLTSCLQYDHDIATLTPSPPTRHTPSYRSTFVFTLYHTTLNPSNHLKLSKFLQHHYLATSLLNCLNKALLSRPSTLNYSSGSEQYPRLPLPR